MFATCFEGVWNVSRRCPRKVWKASEGYLEGFWSGTFEFFWSLSFRHLPIFCQTPLQTCESNSTWVSRKCKGVWLPVCIYMNASIHVWKYFSMQIMEYADILVCIYLSLQIFEYTNIWVCKYESMQVCKYFSVQVLKYASMKV